MAVLVLGIAGGVAGFILMDKNDRVIIKEFVDSSNEPESVEAKSVEAKAE